MATAAPPPSSSAPSSKHSIFARKRAEDLIADTEGDSGLKRSVGALDLTALGIGAIIGTGIYVIIGEAIGKSGPAIVLSFVLAGITCIFSALSYSELASSIPVSGSAYTYGYATLGELIAWIIGWDLILEYGLSIAAVAVGWGAYLKDLLDSLFGISLPDAISLAPGKGGDFNLPAVFLIAAVTALLIVGVRESTRANTVMVLLKIAILIFFVIVGITSFHSGNLKPFAPHGFNGVVDGASLIFFAYIGFDAVSTSSEESKDPGRDLPIAIIASLVIATVIYIAVALAATGLVPAKTLDGNEAPLTTAIREGANLSWAGDILSFGALIAITSVVLTVLYGQTRILFAMCRDGLLPRGLAKLSPQRTPVIITVMVGSLAAAIAAFIPLATIAEMVNIGTLVAFVIVNIGVIILRRTQPDLERRFRVPFVPFTPIIGALLCLYLISKLEALTFVRFGIWMALGLIIYFAYGRTHSALRDDTPDAGVPGEGGDGGGPEGTPARQIVPRGGRPGHGRIR